MTNPEIRNAGIMIFEPTSFDPAIHAGQDILIHVEENPPMQPTLVDFVNHRSELKSLSAEMAVGEDAMTTMQGVYSYLDANSVPVQVLSKPIPVPYTIDARFQLPTKPPSLFQRIKSWIQK